MPLMRKPEMYYYAAECYNNLNNPQKAVDALNAVRVARGILYEKNLPASLSKEEISREIQKEWQKEFAGRAIVLLLQTIGVEHSQCLLRCRRCLVCSTPARNGG